MSITLELSASTEARVRAWAVRAGISPEKYATDLVEAQVPAEPNVEAHKGRVTEAEFDEMIERASKRARHPDFNPKNAFPVRILEGVSEIDIQKFVDDEESDEEELAFIERIRQEIWDENHPRTPGSL